METEPPVDALPPAAISMEPPTEPTPVACPAPRYTLPPETPEVNPPEEMSKEGRNASDMCAKENEYPSLDWSHLILTAHIRM